MRKPTFCICENKDADQLRGLLSKSEISSLKSSSVALHRGLSNQVGNQDVGFLMMQLKS